MSVIQTIHQVVQVSKHRLSGIGSISDFKLSYLHRLVILNTSLWLKFQGHGYAPSSWYCKQLYIIVLPVITFLFLYSGIVTCICYQLAR